MSSQSLGAIHIRPLSAVWGWVVGSIGVFGGMALYIGWQRVRVQAAAFGLRPSTLGITDSDIVVSGARSTVEFLFIVGIALFVAWAGHKLTISLAAEFHRFVALALIAAFSAGMLRGALSINSTGDSVPALGMTNFFDTAYWLAFWAGLAYLCWIAALTHPRPLPTPILSFLKWRHWGLIGAVGSLAVVFTLLQSYATDLGRAYIGYIQEDTSNLPEVRLYSAQDLALTGSTITSSQLPRTEDPAYLFVYSNLFLVGETDATLILIADGWDVDDPVFIVPKSPAIRADLIGQSAIRFN